MEKKFSDRYDPTRRAAQSRAVQLEAQRDEARRWGRWLLGKWREAEDRIENIAFGLYNRAITAEAQLQAMTARAEKAEHDASKAWDLVHYWTVKHDALLVRVNEAETKAEKAEAENEMLLEMNGALIYQIRHDIRRGKTGRE